MEEREAIARLQLGDVGGLEPLVRGHQVRALRTAYLIVRDRSLAEDVVQAAFVKAYERIGQFDARRAFGPWLLKIVLNDAIKAATARERQRSLDTITPEDLDAGEANLTDRSPGPEELWLRAETAEEIWSALEQLTPDQRAAVVARYFLGLSEAQMTGALACPPSTVKWRLHAARNRLRVLLSPITSE
jgi:RNA polymerase sigma-70 factor (ECF subfamily)